MTLLHGSTLLTARTAFFISLRMARHLSSRQDAGAQEYGLYFKLLQRSIGGRGRHTPSLSIPVTGDPRPARRRRLGSGTGCAVGRTLSAGASLSLAGGKQLLLRQCLFDGNKYKPVCAVCQRGIYWSFSSSSAAVSAMVSAPASVSVRRLRNPQLTATRGSPAFRAVDTSTSLSPT